MERGGDPRARPRPGGGPGKPAGRSQGFPGTVHRGGGKRNPDHVPLSPQWQPSARAKIRLQAGVVRAPHRPYRRTSDGRCSCRAGRRLQRRTNCPGHLPNPIFGQQRPHSAGKPSGFARLLAQGWTDALRKLQPEGPLWTFWDYKRERWPLDKGMRLDHFLLSPAMSQILADGGVDRRVRGEENASDHAPVWIVLDL
jgi:hypothetical protein